MAQTGTSLVPPPAFSSAAAGAAGTLALAASAPRPAPPSPTATAAPPAATTRRQRRASGRPFDRPVVFMTSPLFRPWNAVEWIRIVVLLLGCWVSATIGGDRRQGFPHEAHELVGRLEAGRPPGRHVLHPAARLTDRLIGGGCQVDHEGRVTGR